MPSEKQHLERRENIASILQLLRRHGPKSRRQIADELNLSWGCVSELVWMLLSQNILLEQTPATGVKGRAPGFLLLNPQIFFLGVLVEKEGLKASVCDFNGQQVFTYKAALLYDSKEQLLQCVCDFTNDVLSKHPQIRGIGFAMQGIRDGDVWEFPSNPRIYLDFSRELRPQFSLPTLIAHDPDCILYSCLESDRARKLLLHISHGIGASVYDGNGFLKDHPMELGYLIVNDQGQRMQEVASLQALQAAVNTSVDIQSPTPEATDFFDHMGRYLGTALANLCNLIRLDEILLCGEITEYYPLFEPELTKHYEKSVHRSGKAAIRPILIPNAAYGAALMAMDRCSC